jgi:hypothetical protein
MTSTTFVSGTTIESPWLNDVNDLTYNKTFPDGSVVLSALPGSVVDSTLVGYTPAGTGTVGTTVQAKLRESVSVKDFGADPTGVADSTTAFTSAIAAASEVFIPTGTYLISSTLTIQNKSGFRLRGSNMATELKWVGANDGVMMKLTQSRFTTLENFYLNGNSIAGTNLLIDDPVGGTYSTTVGDYRKIRMGNNRPAGTLPALDIGTSTSTQIDVQTFYDCTIENSTKLFRMQSAVTLNINFVSCEFEAYLAACTTTIGMDLISGGNLSFTNCLWVGQAITAMIQRSVQFGLLGFVNCETEIIGPGSPFLYAVDDTASVNNSPVTILNSTLGYAGTGGINWIDYRQRGTLHIQGSTINSSNAVNLNHAPPASALFLDNGNQYINITLVQGANSKRGGFDQITGIFRAPALSGNVYGTGSAISGVMQTLRQGTADATLFRATGLASGGGTANATQCVETNTAMTTVAKNVAHIEDASLILIRGTDGGGNDFLDLVISTNSGTPTVITSKTLSGAPAARTYTTASFVLQLAMASGTYTTNAMWWQMTAR